MSMEYQSDIVLLVLLEVFDECWQLIFQIFVQANMADVYCQLGLSVNTGNIRPFLGSII